MTPITAAINTESTEKLPNLEFQHKIPLMHIIENDFLQAEFLDLGAEWRSLKEKVHGKDFLWNADPKFWPRSAPILFPIVGGLKNGHYTYQNQTLSLGRHGFARDLPFQVVEKEKSRILFRLVSTEETKKAYPFDWELDVEYRLWKKVIQTIWTVRNKGLQDMPFSIGAHPAFNVPFFEDENLKDYFIDFELTENLQRRFLGSDGVLNGQTQILPTVGHSLVLTPTLLADDAVVISKMKSARVTLRNTKNPYSISMEFPGFTHFGIWRPKDAPFVCLEPWCGIADSFDSNGDILKKEGIEILSPGKSFNRTFAVTVEGI